MTRRIAGRCLYCGIQTLELACSSCRDLPALDVDLATLLKRIGVLEQQRAYLARTVKRQRARAEMWKSRARYTRGVSVSNPIDLGPGALVRDAHNACGGARSNVER